jgi:hypothetical protein
MANTTVYFATNRVAQGPTADWRSYGADIVSPMDPSRVTYAAAFVEGTDFLVESSGTITAISHARSGGFEPAVTQDIVGSGKNLLVFIHRFANSFLNAITRAAFNRSGSPLRASAPRTPRSSPSPGRLWASSSRRRLTFLPTTICGTRVRLAARGFTLRAFSPTFSRC